MEVDCGLGGVSMSDGEDAATYGEKKRRTTGYSLFMQQIAVCIVVLV